jgi:hypothetical protein
MEEVHTACQSVLPIAALRAVLKRNDQLFRVTADRDGERVRAYAAGRHAAPRGRTARSRSREPQRGRSLSACGGVTASVGGDGPATLQAAARSQLLSLASEARGTLQLSALATRITEARRERDASAARLSSDALQAALAAAPQDFELVRQFREGVPCVAVYLLEEQHGGARTRVAQPPLQTPAEEAYTCRLLAWLSEQRRWCSEVEALACVPLPDASHTYVFLRSCVAKHLDQFATAHNWRFLAAMRGGNPPGLPPKENEVHAFENAAARATAEQKTLPMRVAAAATAAASNGADSVLALQAVARAVMLPPQPAHAQGLRLDAVASLIATANRVKKLAEPTVDAVHAALAAAPLDFELVPQFWNGAPRIAVYLLQEDAGTRTRVARPLPPARDHVAYAERLLSWLRQQARWCSQAETLAAVPTPVGARPGMTLRTCVSQHMDDVAMAESGAFIAAMRNGAPPSPYPTQPAQRATQAAPVVTGVQLADARLPVLPLAPPAAGGARAPRPAAGGGGSDARREQHPPPSRSASLLLPPGPQPVLPPPRARASANLETDDGSVATASAAGKRRGEALPAGRDGAAGKQAAQLSSSSSRAVVHEARPPAPAVPASQSADDVADAMLRCVTWGVPAESLRAMRDAARAGRERFCAFNAARDAQGSAPPSEAPVARCVLLSPLPPLLQQQPRRMADLLCVAGAVEAIEFLGGDGGRVAPAALVMFAQAAQAEGALAMYTVAFSHKGALTVTQAQRAPDMQRSWQPQHDIATSGQPAALSFAPRMHASPSPPPAAAMPFSPAGTRSLPPFHGSSAAHTAPLLLVQPAAANLHAAMARCWAWGVPHATLTAMRRTAHTLRTAYDARIAALPPGAPEPSEAPPSRSVMLVPLPLSLQKQPLRIADLLSVAGAVLSIEFVDSFFGSRADAGGEKCVPAAIVLLAKRAEADAALALSNTILRAGETLRVTRATRPPDVRYAFLPRPPLPPSQAAEPCAEWGVSSGTLEAMRAAARGARSRYAAHTAALPLGSDNLSNAPMRTVLLLPLPTPLRDEPSRIASLLSVAGTVQAIQFLAVQVNNHSAAEPAAIVQFAQPADAVAALALDGTALCDGEALTVKRSKREPADGFAWHPPAGGVGGGDAAAALRKRSRSPEPRSREVARCTHERGAA